MDNSIELEIADFELMYDTIANMTKVSKTTKIVVDGRGFSSSMKTDGRVARLDVESDAMRTRGGGVATLCTRELNVLSQILYKVQKAHQKRRSKDSNPDYSDVSMTVEEGTRIKVRTNLFKTGFGLVKESAVPSLRTHDFALDCIAEVKVDMEDVKELLSSTFVFRDPKGLRVRINHQDDMVRNVAYAELYDPQDPTTNTLVTKFGNIMDGDLTRKILLDIPRFQVLSLFPVDSFVVKLNRQPCASTDFTIRGRDGTSVSKYRLMFQYCDDPYAVQRQQESPEGGDAA